MSECIIVCVCSPGASLPAYQTEGSAGADLCAFLKKSVTLFPGDFAAIPTGLCFEIPPHYEMQVRPRSGLAAKHGVTLLNAPGTIDSDYRGEVKIILVNHGSAPFTVAGGDRIAQVIVSPVIRARFEAATVISETERGKGGFGSTGTS